MELVAEHVALYGDDGADEDAWTLPDGTTLVEVDLFGGAGQPYVPGADPAGQMVYGRRYSFAATAGQVVTVKLGGRATLASISGDPAAVAGTWDDWLAGFLQVGGTNGGGAGGGPAVVVDGVGVFVSSGGAGASEITLDGDLLVVEPGAGGAGTTAYFTGVGDPPYSASIGSWLAAPDLGTAAVPGPTEPPRVPAPWPVTPPLLDYVVDATDDGTEGGERIGADGFTAEIPTGGGGGGWGGGASGGARHEHGTQEDASLYEAWIGQGGNSGGRHWTADVATTGDGVPLAPIPGLIFDPTRVWRWGFGCALVRAYRPDTGTGQGWATGHVLV